MPSAIYPEFVRQTGNIRGDNEVWDIARCASMRGLPKTCIEDHRVVVPMDQNEVARHIRAHELFHIRLSPPDIRPWLRRKTATLESLLCAEECRVNYAMKTNGFEPEKYLVDPRDESTGYEAAKAKDWKTLIRGIASTYGTAGQEPFLNGVRRAVAEIKEPDLLTDVQMVFTQIDDLLSNSYEVTSDVRINRGKMPMTRGFLVTEHIAQLLDKYIGMADETGKIPKLNKKRLHKAELDNKVGFAPLCHGKAPLTRLHNGNMGKVRLCSATGRNPRRIHRMLTDPYRRIFDRTKRNSGGVVLIDWSGSMGLTESDLHNILNAAPGATVAAYAHMPGTRDVPNFWVLAKDGKMVDKLPEKHGCGNGVDGNALRWALSSRRFANEPIVWVCDGVVTSGHNDDDYHILNVEARGLAVKAKAVMKKCVEDAIDYLKKLTQGTAPSGPILVGPVAHCV